MRNKIEDFVPFVALLKKELETAACQELRCAPRLSIVQTT